MNDLRRGDEIPRSGVILVGGRSARMGRPKAALAVGDRPMLRRVADALRTECQELVLVAAPGEDDTLWRELAGPGPTTIVHDAEAFGGPLAGLVAGLGIARGATTVAVSCDLPFLCPELVGFLFRTLEDAPEIDALVPHAAGHLQTLVAAYRTHPLAARFAAALESGSRSPRQALGTAHVRILSEDEVKHIDPQLRSFANINDETDLSHARSLASD
jgi:molybdopterin-guanine dinucleotide biosynthesis protein A